MSEVRFVSTNNLKSSLIELSGSSPFDRLCIRIHTSGEPTVIASIVKKKGDTDVLTSWLISRGRRLLNKRRKPSPESARFFQKALDSLIRLRRCRVQAARDMFLVYHMLEYQDDALEHRNRLFELFTIPRNRRAMVASVICMFFQQFCGINVYQYYSSTILNKGLGFGYPESTRVSRMLLYRSCRRTD